MAGIKEIGIETEMKDTAIQAVFKAVAKLAATNPVIIQGFGTFKTVTKAARTARNPQSGETILVPAKVVMTFKAAKPAKPKK